MENLKQLKKFIPTIKGISDSNRKGLIHLVEQAERELNQTAVFALKFYADEMRYRGANQPALEKDPYTEHGEPYMQDVTRDWGTIARQALRGFKK